MNIVEENSTQWQTGIIKILMLYYKLTNNNNYYAILWSHININKQKIYHQYLSMET